MTIADRPDAEVNLDYRLEHRFEQQQGRLFLTGWEALVRLPLMQRWRDERNGFRTGGFVSGYPGSPLGGLDSLFRRQRAMLGAQGVHFEPGLNEDLAATSIWGTQYLDVGPVTSSYDGVFGLWYGKGPGVERSTDAMRTASYQGVARSGGVLALAGDDHVARSTVTAQQSETLFMHMHIPVLNPATVQDYLDFGLAGWAMSRFASTWVAMICLNDTADSGATVDVDPLRPHLVVPTDVEAAPPISAGAGVAGAPRLEAEIRSLRHPAAQAFVRANGLDRVVVRARAPRLAVVTAGKSYLDVLDAFDHLGLTLERAGELGITVLKLAMTWPLDPSAIRSVADGVDEVLVVEPKHPLIEDQVTHVLATVPVDRRPRLVGKRTESGEPLVPQIGGLDATTVANILLARLERVTGDRSLVESLRPRERLHLVQLGEEPAPTLVRAAGFCPGCPHNTSTRLPDGTFALGGTGCHGMAISLKSPERKTSLFTQMGGEGALWIGMSPFADRKHLFQNMGDGTYAHSGSLAIRAAVAAGVNITYKILLNGYISMTGGQALPGDLSARKVAQEVLAVGATKVVVVSDDVKKYRGDERLPRGVEVQDRSRLIDVETALQSVPGVSVLVYDQACAAELRRERRRGEAPNVDERVFIHEDVCEGCGDCNVQSNCISVEPLETALGRKRRIDQSSCNKDFTCVSGYCPSFVTVHGARPRAAKQAATRPWREIAPPEPPRASMPGGRYNVVICGIGGAGVLTVGAILGMAAHLEGRASSVLNESGMAQKNGAVQSHVRISASTDDTLSSRVAEGSADLVFAADMVVAASPGVLSRFEAGRTVAVVNDEVRPTVAFGRDGDLDLSSTPMTRVLRRASGDQVELVDASDLALRAFGDAIYGNSLLLGFALQRGLLPVSAAAVERAIELNGVSVEANLDALALGRLVAVEGPAVLDGERETTPTLSEMGLDDLVRHRRKLLVAYQDVAYAERYVALVEKVADAERRAAPGHEELARAVAIGLHKLMAYKDEYEVARLYADPSFRERLEREFEGPFRYSVNLAPQVLNRRDSRTGRARKWAIPSWLATPTFRVLAHGKRVRGTPFDLFGRTEHRRAERARIDEYIELIDEITANLNANSHELAVQLALLPEQIRGFDTVKDSSAAEVEQKQAELLSEFRAVATPR